MPKLRPDLSPFWTTTDGETVKLYLGNVIDVLRQMPEKSVQCVVTSPPYWGLRSYLEDSHDNKHLEIGTEETPEEYVTKMTEVFREVRRVLRDDGTLWLNLGDSYGNGGNLVGVPWRVALALQADGWVLRQDIIWHKPSPMPESVTNRCTKAHEYVFLLTKSQRYFYDAEAIKTPGESGSMIQIAAPGTKGKLNRGAFLGNSVSEEGMSGNARIGSVITWGNMSNKRSVWTIASQGYPGAHFATFPPNLIEPMILAGTSAHGCCANCGAPWKRVVGTKQLTRERPNDYVKRMGEEGTGNSCSNSIAGVETKTVGWEQTCNCETDEVVPCVVLDPFCGSGTTMCVSLANGRHSVGIDLSEKYLSENTVPRIEGEILKVPGRRNLVEREVRAVTIKSGF